MRISCLFLFAALATGGCADSNSPAPLPPTIDNDEALGDLDDEQAEDLCEYSVRVVADTFDRQQIVHVSCAIPSLIAGTIADSRSACRAAYDDCLADPPPEVTEGIEEIDPVEECAGTSSFLLTGCSATAAQYRDCLGAAQRVFDTALGSLNCSQVGADDPFAGLEELDGAISAECEGILEDCGGFVPEIPIEDLFDTSGG